MAHPTRSVPPPGPTVARFPAEKRSDASLVAGVAAGEREALAVIWDRYSGLVRGVLYGALGPDTSLEDLVQEVFLALIQGAARIQDGEALRGYLASVAARQAALEIRKRRIRRWVGLSPSGELPERALERVDFEHREVLRALHRVLGKLSARRRMAFVLRHVQGLEMLETAAALGVSESTVRRELESAREFLLKAREPALQEFLSRREGLWP
ncbi:sigma-70 family RNA polymerase sigma factor [Sorangium sp. So ce136]|uniref:RNA polymerase sigma factor n=1 Tax=Sorangium sp. So ce136 TaxID=3133284 RepID=UPI003F027D99